MTQEFFENEIRKLNLPFGNLIPILGTTYSIKSLDKIKFICKKCNSHQKEYCLDNLRNNHKGCPICRTKDANEKKINEQYNTPRKLNNFL